MQVKIQVTLKKSVLDPQGEAVRKGLLSLGFGEVEQVRMGKYFELELHVKPGLDLKQRVNQMCQKLLSNPVIEDFEVWYPPEV
ncbi:phosphoribosylformylglycinamidine synthase subunit PurS [bacterium]|nr:phosphoribosylformylglycinamidine synthase subunit PurS [bacterium]